MKLEEVGGLVERLREDHNSIWQPLMDEAATALEAQAAELAVVQRQIVAAWNAFGPSSSRNDPPAFDADDLEHLPITAGGGLDEQIRELEDRTERAEAALSEARKALEEAREVVDVCAGDNRPARAWAITVRDGIDAALIARRALTGGQEDGNG